MFPMYNQHKHISPMYNQNKYISPIYNVYYASRKSLGIYLQCIVYISLCWLYIGDIERCLQESPTFSIKEPWENLSRHVSPMYSVYFPMLIIHWRYREIPRENLQCIIHINIYLQCMCIFCLKKIFRGTDAAVVAVGAKYISTTIYWNTLQHAATHCNTLQHTATHCNALQYAATHCNTLQHTAAKRIL